jgi:amidase
MNENHLTRRDVLKGLAALPFLGGTMEAQARASSVCFMSAVEMARLIRTKKLSAREALAMHLAQIERVNPKVNAIVTLVPELAAAAAAKADEALARGERLGPLHGLPVAHKDLLDTRGIRTTFGSPLYKDNVPTEDDIVVERMRRAGAITIGKTNTPEFGSGSQTFNTVFGATNNPYDLTKTCGGSSGGAAVALACGLVPVASGSDTGGSLRNPAAFCNVVGFRPSPGRVPNPRAAFAWWTLSTAGCLGRSVADLALALSTIAGPDSRAPLSINEPGERFARPLNRDFKGVRVAWYRDLGGVPFDPRVRAVVDAHRKTFESLGCIVDQAGARLRAGRGGLPRAACVEHGEFLRRTFSRAPGSLQGHPDGRNRRRTAAHRYGRGSRRSGAWASLATFSGLPRDVRVFRAAHDTVAAV